MASVVVTMDAREAALFRAQQKIIAKQVALNEKMKEGGQASQKAGQQAKQAFGGADDAIGKAKNSTAEYVKSLGLAATAAAGIKTVWETINQEQQAGLAAIRQTIEENRRLLQVSNPQEYSERTKRSDELAVEYGYDREKVRQVLFAGVSEGFEGDVESLIRANQVVDPEAAAKVAGQLPVLFGGKVAPMEAVDLTLAAAGGSRLDFEQMAQGIPSVAEGGGIANASPQETLAALSLLSSEFGSGQTAADRLKGFATKTGLAGMEGFAESVKAIQAMSEEDREKFLGDADEMNIAYVKLVKNLDALEQRTAEIFAEQKQLQAGKGILEQKIRFANANPELSAVRQAVSAEQALAITQANVSGVGGASAESAQKIAQTKLLSSGDVFQRSANEFLGDYFVRPSDLFAKGASGLGYGPEQAGTIGAELAKISTTGSVSGLTSLIGAVFTPSGDKFMKAAEKMEKAADKLNQTNITNAARSQAAQ